MTHIVWLIGIVVVSQMTGCASLVTSRGNANDRIEYWLSQQEYGKALAVVADLKGSPSPASNNLREIQEKINAQIATYEQQVMAKAESAVAANDWGAAFDLYREALSRVPDSQRLQQGQRRLLQRHAEYLDKLELERLIAKGEWTLKDLEVSRLAGASNSGGWLGRYLLSRKLASAHELALEMEEHGKHALERKDQTLARRILTVAWSLLNAIQRPTLETRLQERIEEETRILGEQQRAAETHSTTQRTPSEQPSENGRSATNSQEQKDTKLLMADLRKAGREKNLVEAQKLMSELERRGVETQEFRTLSRQIASDVAKHAKHLIEIGATHYSQQRYQEAMDVWKQAHALDPDNEQLNARIKRVTRVLEKLQDLRNKSSGTQ